MSLVIFSQPIGIQFLGSYNYEYFDMTSFKKSSILITSTEGKPISLSTLKWWSSVTMLLFVGCALMKGAETLNLCFG